MTVPRASARLRGTGTPTPPATAFGSDGAVGRPLKRAPEKPPASVGAVVTRAFSLLELMLVLASVAVLASAVALSLSLADTGRIHVIVGNVDTLRQSAARWLERGRVDYSALTLLALTTEGELPSAWSASNPYGGLYTAGPGSDPTRLTVTVTGLPTSVGTTLTGFYTGRVQSVSFALGTLTITF